MEKLNGNDKPSWLKYGVKVVCIDTRDMDTNEYYDVIHPSLNKIYTIRDIFYCLTDTGNFDYLINVREIVNNRHFYYNENAASEQAWEWRAFKPLVKLNKTIGEDVFLFEPLLLTRSEDELV